MDDRWLQQGEAGRILSLRDDGDPTQSMITSRPAEFGDDELVALAQQGQRQAFEALVERYKHKAYRIAFDFTRDREEAKDLSQEAFLNAFSHLKDFDRRAKFYTWFYRILVNLCIDYRRRKTKIRMESLDERMEQGKGTDGIADPAPSADRQAISRQMSERIGAALAALPAKQRATFLLKNHEGLSISEIAKVMKAAEGAVKSHLHRAVTALKQRLVELR